MTPRAFAEIAASGVGRELLMAIRELERGPNQVDLERTSATSSLWIMFPKTYPANEWRVVFWFDAEGAPILWIYAVTKTAA